MKTNAFIEPNSVDFAGPGWVVANPDITPFWDYFRVGGDSTGTRKLMNVRILRLVGDERICILARSGHYYLKPGPLVFEDVAAGPPFRRRPSSKDNVRLKFRTFECRDPCPGLHRGGSS